ncbi:hypothetical protein ACFV2H_52660 [Streptomyces sp. NPDC059629]|uniref:hypothetical protein n=1 Tax=Streptomyces sp. NPDC059629 TaxID=3346889 RepID=UPI0036B6A99B
MIVAGDAVLACAARVIAAPGSVAAPAGAEIASKPTMAADNAANINFRFKVHSTSRSRLKITIATEP